MAGEPHPALTAHLGGCVLIQRKSKKSFNIETLQTLAILLKIHSPMKQNFLSAIVLGLLVINIGCAAPRTQVLNQIQPGMTKQEVIKIMGPPVTVASDGGAEYMTYRLATSFGDFNGSDTSDYFVRIIDGKVDAYGQKGDFNTTKNPTADFNINQNVRTEKRSVGQEKNDDLYTKLRKLQQLRDDKVITEEEFQRLKKQAIESTK
jgi:outer membrane protein assembly factor BamE (lipoprotein component of BamABCDE complex)